MTKQFVKSDSGESKAPPRVPRKFWFAVCSDMFEHEIVGADVKAPKPVDPKRQSWQPFVAWQWLIKEAARQDRERIIKGKVIPLRRGQVAVSQRYLAREANWGRQAIREFFVRLERHGMVAVSRAPVPESANSLLLHSTFKSNPAITVLTICNYDVYQRAPKASNPRTTQQQPSSNPRLYIETEETGKTVSSSSDPLKEEETAKPLQLAPSIVDELRGVVGQKRADELVAEYLASPYAKGARFINRAFKGWLAKGGIPITGQGDAAFKLADALAMCPKDGRGRAATKLPTSVSNGHDWRATARRVAQ